MANALYDTGRNACLLAGIHWLNDTFRVVLVDAADYTPSLTTHQWLSQIPAAGRVATSAPLTNRTAVAGVFDADDPVFPGVTGDQSEYLIVYKDTGNAATSQLFAFIDTATNLPVQPNSGDIAVVFSNGPEKIGKL